MCSGRDLGTAVCTGTETQKVSLLTCSCFKPSPRRCFQLGLRFIVFAKSKYHCVIRICRVMGSLLIPKTDFLVVLRDVTQHVGHMTA
jgi:hypothetical protein